MHYDFESTARDSTQRIAEENRQGNLEATVELKIAKIRNSFERLDTLAGSYDSQMLPGLSALFELNRSTIAHDILEAKSLLLELKVDFQSNAEQMKIQSISNYRFELEKFKTLETQIGQMEARLIGGDEKYRPKAAVDIPKRH